MTITLLVVLAVSAVIAFLMDRHYQMVNQFRLNWRYDGKALTHDQVKNRKLLRHVVWLWMYGYAPPGLISRSQRQVIGFVTALAIASLLSFIVLPIVGWLR